MKLWLSGLALLLASSTVLAGNYRIVQSPSQKLDVWIDDIKDNSPQSWCGAELPLRIVTNGDKNPFILSNFMPRLGTLLASQCETLGLINWQLVDPQDHVLANGSASKESDWALVIAPQTLEPTEPPPIFLPRLTARPGWNLPSRTAAICALSGAAMPMLRRCLFLPSLRICAKKAAG